VKNITEGGFFVDFDYGILKKREYIIIVCKICGKVVQFIMINTAMRRRSYR
jgi:hypothetical protein